MKSLIAALAGLLVVTAIVLCHYSWADGFVYAVAEFFVGRTVYSPGYSERAYIDIEPGHTLAEIEQVLGKPLKIITLKGLEYHNYSTWAKGNTGADWDYSYRILIFSNNVLVGKEHGYYVE
jgi:hypothetical protein